MRAAGTVAQNIGDCDRIMAGAVIRVEAPDHVPFLAHTTMELMNFMVHVREDSCAAWAGSRMAAQTQTAMALRLRKMPTHVNALQRPA
jgi:hypothetical protein